MSIAVFTESYAQEMGVYRRQVLLVPHGTGVRVYMRVTDGLKGPQNAWEETDIESVMSLVSDDELLTKEVSGVVVTTADYEAITQKGYSPVLGTKAVAAHNKAPATNSPLNASQTIAEMYEKVEQGVESLEDLVVDKRRQRGIPTQPVVNIPVAHAAPPALNMHLASVPRKELATRYVHRNVLGNIEEFKVFDYARDNNINVLIYGPTGPGKTTAVEAWAADRDLRMATVSGNAALEPGHLFGKLIPNADVNGPQFIWVDGPVTDVVRNGGVLLLDELNFISPKIYTVLYGLLDARRSIVLLDHMGEVIEAHKDLTVFATMNPDYAGTTPLNFAMRNRFDIQIPWDYDDSVESKLVPSKALRTMVKQLRDEADKGSFETPISTNMLIEFAQFVKDLGFDFASENFVAHFAADEQAAVRLVVKTHEVNLQRDLGVYKEPKVNVEVLDEVTDKDMNDQEIMHRLSSMVHNQPTN